MKAYKRIIALTLCALTCVCNVTYVSAEETTETNEATETNGAANSGVVEMKLLEKQFQVEKKMAQ